ncbi:MAG: acyl-CoA dehydrogenase, partial [Kiritimatiellia bacterium]|nr:acyl-CoA dehydrogenase [Kiritimatiellia bacterium]
MDQPPFSASVFRSLPESELLSTTGYPPEFLRVLLRSGVLRHLFGPEGTAAGRLQTVRECAYFSVEMALSLGIVVSLFTDPVRRYRPDLWQGLEEEFLTGGRLGGMMITEPGCGTDMTACQTRIEIEPGGSVLRGTKHWAGLSGLADYWLVLARDDPPGRWARFPSLNFYVCRADPDSFRLLKRYGSAGLRSIPYGMTRIESGEGLLGPLFSGNRTDRFRSIHGLLQRSRISIAAIVCGACERLAEQATEHAASRLIFGKPMAEFGQVRTRLAEIDAARAINRVLFQVACREASLSDTTGSEIPALTANAVKVVCTDLAFAAANSASQLLGGESYRTDTYIGRAAADLRPFRIFEGSNDVLCDALWQAVEKEARTGGPGFEERVKSAFNRVQQPIPDLQVFRPRTGP